MAAVWALAGAMCDDSAAAPSRRCSHRRLPASSEIAIVTAQLFLSASASAAAAMALTSASSRKDLVFMAGTVVGKVCEHSAGIGPAVPGCRNRDLRFLSRTLALV